MTSLFAEGASAELIERLNALMPQSRPLWGRMTVTAMLAHVADTMRFALGEMEAPPERSLMSRWPFNWLLVNVLPWPKGKAQAPPAFLERAPGEISAEREAVERLILRCASAGAGASWPVSTTFGKLSGQSWGVLLYRHCDHHLRQFGV